MAHKILLEKAKELAEEFDVQGAVVILHKKGDQGQRISQFGLTHQQVRECLAVATFYNEKLEIEN